ncbi:MAG: leucyl aminopeptidase [Gemmatimonadota bacterium]
MRVRFPPRASLTPDATVLTTSVLGAAPDQHATPFLAVIVPQSGSLPPSLAPLDKSSGGALARAYAAGDVSGKKDETVLLYPAGPAKRILLVGIGKPGDLRRQLRRAAAVAAKRARLAGAPTGALFVTPEAQGVLAATEMGQVVAEGLGFGAWHYADLKQPPEDPKPNLEAFQILAPGDTPAVTKGHARGAAAAAGQSVTRGLQVLPANLLPPRVLAERAQEIAKRHDFPITVLDRAGCEKEGMGALMSIAKGSAEEPRFIVLEYKGGEGAPVVLVGKGVTFDTGGISIKPAANMEDMKYDMSGAAAVLGVFEMLGRVKPKVNVIGLIPSAENMPSGTAVKPGDVVKSHLGKTIEVINTDAEGRLLLVDALSWARRYKPAVVVDAATLTGAIVIALGNFAIGVMGNDDALVEELRQAGERSGERAWPLPLWDEYRELNKSDVADVKNTGGRAAGSITAGWFLKEFAEGLRWAHLDIAGTAYTEREDAGSVKGPTGIAVRLWSEFLFARAG